MTTLLAVFRQVGLTAHGLKLRPMFARAVCWRRIYLPQAWIVCWKGPLNIARLGLRLAGAPLLIWILLTMSLLAELLKLLVPTLETMASEAASLGLDVNWQKTKVQALGCREDMPLTIKVHGSDVMVVKEFVYLGSLIHSTTGSTCYISRRSAITHAAMQSLENQIWRSQLPQRS